MSETYLQNITPVYPATRVKTRGYMGDIPGLKRAVEARMQIGTWNPVYTVSVVTDGQAESAVARSISKSRTKFSRPFTRADYDETNASDDALDPYREDYSVVIPTAGINLGSGIQVDIHQVIQETLKLKSRGSWFQIDLSVSQGRIQVKSIELDAIIQDEPRQKSQL